MASLNPKFKIVSVSSYSLQWSQELGKAEVYENFVHFFLKPHTKVTKNWQSSLIQDLPF